MAYIHQIKGKEAKPRAINWAAEKRYLLNVAAKRKLYIIGDKNSWQTRSYFSESARVLPTLDY